MNEAKPPRKPLLFYYGIVIAILLLLNMFVFPWLTNSNVTEADYSDFLNALGSGQISAVQVEEKSLYYMIETQDGEKTQKTVYITNKMEDDNVLTNRLSGAGIKFAKVLPKEILSS